MQCLKEVKKCCVRQNTVYLYDQLNTMGWIQLNQKGELYGGELLDVLAMVSHKVILSRSILPWF
jgi:hypothetical protein